jgi:hypothetical protein
LASRSLLSVNASAANVVSMSSNSICFVERSEYPLPASREPWTEPFQNSSASQLRTTMLVDVEIR